jgi:pimeloyl-ACP methyl ester carboxylesterase
MTKRGFAAGITALLVAIVVVSGVAAAAPPPAYFVDESKLPFDALAGTTTARYWGVHGGAGYRIEVPANWNGELVLYAHGFRGTGLELTITNPRIRQLLVKNGYAWAASSFATNGYDVKQGVKDTHALGALFNGLVGNPRRTYITGHSMGGHITGVAIEQYPQAFVGALPMCGVMGDNDLFSYYLDFNLVAEELAGVQAQFPFPANYQTAVVPGVKAALAAAYPLGLNAQGLKLFGVTRHPAAPDPRLRPRSPVGQLPLHGRRTGGISGSHPATSRTTARGSTRSTRIPRCLRTRSCSMRRCFA